MNREVTGNKLAGCVEVYSWVIAAVAALALGFLILNPVPRASAASFHPKCLKKDGDWLDGVNRAQCVGKDVRGKWITKSVLKKARKVW